MEEQIDKLEEQRNSFTPERVGNIKTQCRKLEREHHSYPQVGKNREKQQSHIFRPAV